MWRFVAMEQPEICKRACASQKDGRFCVLKSAVQWAAAHAKGSLKTV
ncbi:hypothetical protein [Kingella oralis]